MSDQAWRELNLRTNLCLQQVCCKRNADSTEFMTCSPSSSAILISTLQFCGMIHPEAGRGLKASEPLGEGSAGGSYSHECNNRMLHAGPIPSQNGPSPKLQIFDDSPTLGSNKSFFSFWFCEVRQVSQILHP